MDSRPKLLGLNQDVLAHIISYLSPRDAASLSHTSKGAHVISTDPALHTVVLDGSVEQIQKFRDYLLPSESRSNRLKCLTLSKGVTWDVEHTTIGPAGALADIIDKADKLQLFSCGTIEALIAASGGRIVNALTSLKYLRVLTLQEGGPEAAKLVTSLNSSLLRELNASMPFIADTHFRAFFSSLARYRHLETLTLNKLHRRLLFSNVPESNIPISMPSIRTLSLHDTYLPMSVAVAIFPNVQYVTFRNCRHFPTPLDIATSLDPLAHMCWQNTLAEAHIDVHDLNVWPLACRVRWLDFDFLPGGFHEEALSAVDQTKPHVLSCAYRVDPDNLFWVRLPVIAVDLRFLDARILELSGHRKRYVLWHLSHFPALTAVSLYIRAYYQPEDHDAELESIATELASTNRCLQFIGLSLIDGRFMRDDEPVFVEERLGSRWWKVDRDKDLFGEVKTMTVVPTEVGLRVKDYMYKADYNSLDWEGQLAAFA